MEVKKSVFSFIGFTITESHIIREPKSKAADLKIEIKPSGYYYKKSKGFQLELKVRVFEENKRFDANINCLGLFKFKGEPAESELSNYFYINSPAIIFPYIRAYISALTALSGMEAINIPTMNLTHLIKELKENTTVLDGN